jgi:hypothetical protein
MIPLTLFTVICIMIYNFGRPMDYTGNDHS